MTEYNQGTIPPAPDAANLPPYVEDKASGLAITTLVIGIASCTICCYMGFILGVLSIILGLVEKTKINSGEHSEKGRGMSTWGIVCGVLGIIANIIFTIIMIITAANNPNMFN